MNRAAGPPAIEHDPRDTSNHFFVGATIAGNIVVTRQPVGELTPAAAINLAAWLVALSGADCRAEFDRVLRAILAT